MKLKICLTCDHHVGHPEGHACSNPELIKIDPVTGEKMTTFCRDERSERGRCGPDGSFHETGGELTPDEEDIDLP